MRRSVLRKGRGGEMLWQGPGGPIRIARNGAISTQSEELRAQGTLVRRIILEKVLAILASRPQYFEPFGRPPEHTAASHRPSGYLRSIDWTAAVAVTERAPHLRGPMAGENCLPIVETRWTRAVSDSMLRSRTGRSRARQ